MEDSVDRAYICVCYRDREREREREREFDVERKKILRCCNYSL